MKAQTNWTIGKAGSGFTVALSVEVPEKELGALLGEGLCRLGQRASDIDSVLGGYTKGADGKRVRKQVTGEDGKLRNWTRGDVEFTPEMAESLKACFATLEFTDASKEIPHALNGIEVVVGPYSGDGKAAPKYAREKAKFAEKESSEAGLDAFLTGFCGYTGPSHGEDGEYHPAALAAAKVAIDKYMADALKRLP